MELYIADAFADRVFAGNPAAVCLLETRLTDKEMQDIAMEMNLSETAFLHPAKQGFDLRWFTPKTEVSLCGHATLASAHVLWETEKVPRTDAIRFFTQSGVLTAFRHEEWIALDFPERKAAPFQDEGFLDAMGVNPVWMGRFASPKGSLYLIELENEETVRGLCPDFNRLLATGISGLIVTARAEGSAYDFVSRFFAPAMGINEDPVTGSAHCCLAPFWTERLGKPDLTGLQVSNRSGVVRCRWDNGRVHLMGKAKTFLRGRICIQ